MKKLLLLLMMLTWMNFQVNADVEPGNNTSGTTTDLLSPTGSQSGTLSPTDQNDFYQINLSADGKLTFSLSNATNEYMYVYLYDANGTTQLGSTNGYAGSAIGFSRDGLSAGTYYIQVNCAQATSYSISSSFQAPGFANDVEINDTPAQALTLNNNVNAEGHIKFYKNGGSTDDNDYYIYTTTQDGNITINLMNDNNGYCYVYLLDNDGSTIIATTNGYGSAGISFTANGIAAGTYYILIQALSFSAYTLNATLTPSTIPNDGTGNNYFNTAVSFPQNSSTTGHIAYRYNGNNYDTEDYYSFYSNGDYNITISLSNNTNGYTYIYLYDTDTTTLLGTTNGYAQSGISFSVNGLAAGTYYIRVNAGAGNFSGYTISNSYTANPLSNDAEPNNIVAQANATAYNEVDTGHIAYRQIGGGYDEYDYYVFTTPVDGNISLSLENNTNGYTYIYLYDSNGTTQLGTTNGYAGSPISFTVNGLAAGTYYAMVYAGAGNYSGYKLTKSLTPTVYSADTEPNNSTANALPFALNSTLNGHIAHRYNGGGLDDYDYYLVNTTADGNISLTISNNNNNYLYLYLYDTNGVTQLASTNGYGGSGITCSAAGLAAGSYYVVVNAGSGNFAGYTLSNTLTPTPYLTDAEPNNTSGTATLLNNHPTKTGHIAHRFNGGSLDSDDYWQINQLTTDSFKLDVNFALNNYTYVYLYNSSNTQLYSNNGYGGTYHIAFSSLPAGTYYLKINAGQYNAYNFSGYYWPCDPSASVITAGGPTTFCQGGSVGLNLSGVYNNYLWSTGATTGSISATASGNYSLTAYDFDGCPHPSNSISVSALPNNTWYADSDGDNYGNPGLSQTTCTGAPVGYVADNTDCNDGASTVNPGAAELCNGIDDDCDGLSDEGLTFSTWYADADGDNYGNASSTTSACSQPSGYVSSNNDCNDNNNSVNPGVTELCNGIDDNCDGFTDEGCNSYTWFADGDGDTFGNPAVSTTTQTPSAPSGYVNNNGDCNDNNSSINPSATETCNNIDDDCNGLSDDGLTFITYYTDSDGDGFGASFATGISSCSIIAGTSTNNNDCNDNNNTIYPGATETCNSIDDDCDGSTDEGLTFITYFADADGDSYGDAGTNIQTCNGQPFGYVTNSNDCNDNQNSTNPSATELCNGIDDNCDGFTDEGCGGCPDPGPINGPAQLCAPTGQQITYSVAVVPGASAYNWTVPTGTIIVSGQGTNSIVVRWTFAAIHAGLTGNICVSTNNSCGVSNPSCLNISVQLSAPVRPQTISGNSLACDGDLVVYSVATVSRATSYNWTVPTGAQIINGQGTNMISVLYNSSFSGGSITVNAANGCGTGPDRSKTVSRNILKAPANINGLANGVCGASGVGYTCANVTGASTYQWTVPAGATITSGQGTSTILVSFNGAFTTGAITVTAGNACGYGAVRSLTVSGAPAKADPISGPAIVCTNTVYTYEVAAIPGVSSYNWVVPASVQILSGQGTKTITVRSPLAPTASFAISVYVSNACGTSVARKLSGISANACPRISENFFSNVDLHPNPITSTAVLSITSASNATIGIQISDLSGRIVRSQQIQLNEGENRITLSLDEISSGLYLLHLNGDDHQETLRIIKE